MQMRKMMLVQGGEHYVDHDLLEAIVRNHQDDLFISFDYVRVYTFVEGLPYETDHISLISDLEHQGFKVWLVVEPNKGGFSEVVYYHGKNPDKAVKLMQDLIDEMHEERQEAE